MYFPDGFFFLFILWKDAKGGPGEEELSILSLYFVQFVFFLQFLLYPSVRFSFVKPGCLI